VKINPFGWYGELPTRCGDPPWRWSTEEEEFFSKLSGTYEVLETQKATR
jgi:hypothetical protein